MTQRYHAGSGMASASTERLKSVQNWKGRLQYCFIAATERLFGQAQV